MTPFRDSLAAISGRLVAAVAAWGLSIALARLLGNTVFGEYVALTAVLQLLGVIPDFGLNRVLVRDVAVDSRSATAYIRRVIQARIVLFAGAGAASVVIALAFPGLQPVALLIGALGLAPLIWTRTGEAALYALGSIPLSATLSALYAVGRLVLSAIAAGIGFGLVGVMFGQGVAGVCYALATIAVVRTPPSPAGTQLSWVQLFKASYPYAILATLETLYSRVDVLLLAVLTGSPQSVALYGAAYKLFEATTVPVSSYSAVLVPTYAKRLAARDRWLGRSVARTVAASMLVAALPALVMFAAAAGIVSFLYGPSYVDASGSLLLLSIAAIPAFGVYPLAALLAASHEQSRLVVRSVLQVAVNVAANLVLIPPYGPRGAAAAMIITTALGLVLYGDLVIRHVLARRL